MIKPVVMVNKTGRLKAELTAAELEASRLYTKRQSTLLCCAQLTPMALVLPAAFASSSARHCSPTIRVSASVDSCGRARRTAWEMAAPQEYGFYANVNPPATCHQENLQEDN